MVTQDTEASQPSVVPEISEVKLNVNAPEASVEVTTPGLTRPVNGEPAI